MATQTFFIPEKISGLRLSKLPLSASLIAVLKKLNVGTFGDLSGMTIRDFQRVSNRGVALFAELTGLTQRARDGEFVAAFRQNIGLLNSTAMQNSRMASPLEADVKKNGVVSSTRLSVPLSQAPTDEHIFIPQEARGLPISAFQISVRLRHIFEYKRFCILGDIHGVSYAELRGFRNCGQKTITELRELVRQIQHAHPAGRADGISLEFPEHFVAQVGDCLTVPASVRDLKFCDLPVSVRLGNILGKRKATKLGELNGVSVSELKRVKNCGRKTISEIVNLIEKAAAGEFKVVTETSIGWTPADLIDLVEFLDTLVAELSARDVEILKLRLAGKKEQLFTLQDVGAKFKLSRERIRQIVKQITERLRKAGSRKLNAYLHHVEHACNELVCPLTPPLLAQWLGEKAREFRFPPSFYLRLLCELHPAIPAWPEGQEPSSVNRGRRRETVETALKLALQNSFRPAPLPEALAQIQAKLRGLGIGEFLDVLRHSRQLRVEFPRPDCPVVRLARYLAPDIARIILQDSTAPLTPEDILSKAQTNFGADAAKWIPRTLGNALTEEKGFYLLGPRAYGLRQHFTLPEPLVNQAKLDFEELLKREKHPLSTPDVIGNKRFDWTGQTNSYELACVLREDERFIDLGKFLFALSEWGVQERQYVKDLIPRILEKAGRPLTGPEVLDRLQQLRSVSPYAISGHLRKHPQVRDYGFGHFGLKSWGDSVQANIVTDSTLVERVIRRGEPPLRFARLCEILNFPAEGTLVEKLWQTCAALPGIIRLPDECSGTTRLIHKTCRLERALVATAREVNRPLPLYEFQWELNERFGSLFAAKSSDELRRCLEQSPMFLRDADDEFILDVHLEQLGLDAAAIRGACFELLFQTNEIVGCEDLLERLEMDGKSWEELSADILASLLRDDERFQEVGRDRFRVKACKH